MAALIRAGISKRGKPAIVDENEFTYTGNASGLLTNNGDARIEAVQQH